MAKTVVGLFDTAESAERAVRELYSRGFSRDDVSLVANNSTGIYDASSSTSGDGTVDDTAEAAGAGAVSGTMVGGGLGLLVGLAFLFIPGIGPVAAAGTLATVLGTTALGAGLGAAAGGLIGALTGAGVPEEEANIYAEGVRRGGSLVTVSTTDDRADEAVAALEANDPVNVEERESSLRESGWSRFDPEAEPLQPAEIETYRSSVATRPTTSTTTAAAATQTTLNEGDEMVVPVVEEQLQVGKREVQRGGVRVHSRIVEVPVEEQVQIREERVNIERRPVDRAVTSADASAFQESSMELRESSEEVVVDKQARVVEEITVEKDVTEHTETVRDTVRRTDVDIQETTGQTSSTGYETYATDFRSYYNTNLASSGGSYETYDPAFRYGHTLASDKRYQGKDWATFESDARTSWEKDRPGTWEQFKDSVRYAWDKARGRA